MTTPRYPTESEPYIWLQEDEDAGIADCGCRLAQDLDTGAKLNQCSMHAAAGLLLEALSASDDDGTWAGLIEIATAGRPPLTGSPIYEGDKYPEIIGEAWQAMSVLSDAQELLDPRDPRCNDQINHAKRHLIRAFELAREQDAVAFRKAIMLIDCTLQDGEEHGTTDTPIKNVRRELVGHVGVDRARIMICDPSYIQDQRLCERDLEMEDSQLKDLEQAQSQPDMPGLREAYPLHYQIPYLLGHEGAAVVVRSGLGDGNYPVTATIAEVAQWGERVVRLEIDFLDSPFLPTVPLELPDAMGKLLQELQAWLKERVETGGPGYGADGFLRRINTIMESYEGRD